MVYVNGIWENDTSPEDLCKIVENHLSIDLANKLRYFFEIKDKTIKELSLEIDDLEYEKDELESELCELQDVLADYDESE